MRERKNACERNRPAKGGKIEREKECPIWAEFELISRWLVVVAYNGDDLAKGMREREKRLREKSIWQREERKRERDKKRRPDLVVARDGEDWCGGGGLWRSNEGSMRRESFG